MPTFKNLGDPKSSISNPNGIAFDTSVTVLRELAELRTSNKRLEQQMTNLESGQQLILSTVSKLQKLDTADNHDETAAGTVSIHSIQHKTSFSSNNAGIGVVAASEASEAGGTVDNVLALNSSMVSSGLWSLSINQWPYDIELRRDFRCVDEQSRKQSLRLAADQAREVGGMSHESSLAGQSVGSNVVSSCVRIRLHVLHPAGVPRLIVDVLSILFLGYDMFAIPYTLAWGFEVEGFWRASGIMSCAFWSMELFCGLVTGYFKDGELVADLRQIAWHSLTTSFFPNLCLVGLDWLNLVADTGSTTSVRLLRFIKTSRLIRIAAVIRMFRFTSILDRLEGFSTRNVRLILQVPLLLLVILWVDHLLSCAWWSIGRIAPSDTGTRWTYAKINGIPYAEHNIEYQYFSSFHWALTQMTPGSLQIHAETTWERIFSCFVLFMGLVFVSALTSTITTKMTQFSRSMQEREAKMGMVRRFIRENSVPKQLSMQVQEQLKDRLAGRAVIGMEEVSAFSLLSVNLERLLKYELSRPWLIESPFFSVCDAMNSNLMRNISHTACRLTVYPKDDHIFSAGSEANDIYRVLSSCIYTHASKNSTLRTSATSSLDRQRSPQSFIDVEPGSELSQAALWTYWTHVGDAETTAPCKVLVVNCAATLEILRKDPSLWVITAEYATKFRDVLLSSSVPPTDIQPIDDPYAVFPSLSQRVREIVGLHTLGVFRQSQLGRLFMAWSGYQTLASELERFHVTFLPSPTHGFLRIISVTAVEFACNGKVLVEVGKFKNGSLSIDCELPGGKVLSEEDSRAAIERILQHKLAPLASALTHKAPRLGSKAQKSTTYGIHSQYLLNVFHGEIPDEAQHAWADSYSHSGLRCGTGPRRPSISSNHSNLMELLTSSKLEIGDMMQNRLMAVASNINGATYLFAWFSQEEFRSLQSAAGHEALHQWISSLKITDSSKSSGLREPDTHAIQSFV